MPRPRKSSKKPKNEPAAAPVTGAAPPPGWTPPRGQAVPAATPPNGAPEPPPAVQPQIRIEQVPNADRPTFKVYGHDAAASTYVQRAREFEDEERELAAGKKYFRDLASDLRAQHGAETAVFCSPFGHVRVIASETRRELDPAHVAAATQSPRVGGLVEQVEVVKGDDWTHILDGAFVQMPDGQWSSVRQAITSGVLPLRIDRKAKLVKEFRQRAAGLGPTLTPEEKQLLERLEGIGFNAASVRVDK